MGRKFAFSAGKRRDGISAGEGGEDKGRKVINKILRKVDMRGGEVTGRKGKRSQL